MTTAIDMLPVMLAVLLLGWAALSDLAYRLLPNWVPALLAADGIAVRMMAGSLPAGVLAGAGVFAACAILWRLGAMGGGDVKLFGAAALAVPSAPDLLVATTLAGGVLALLYLVLRRLAPRPSPQRPTGLLHRLARIELRRIRGGRSLPYCCAIAAGAVLTLVEG